jgi:hypothetical protein
MPPVPLARTSRWLSVALALVGASALTLSVQGGRWWQLGELAIGPFGSSGCFEHECRVRDLAWIGGDGLWLRSGVATYAGALITAVMLVIVAGGLAAGRRPRLAARTSLVAAATAAVAGVLFWSRFPGISGAVVGRGIVLFVAGLATTLGASVIVLWPTRAAPPGRA